MIYAFASNDRIKIGHTDALSFGRARDQMRPGDRILLGVYGTYDQEQRFHRHFRGECLGGEWYPVDGEVAQWVAWAQEQPWSAVEDCDLVGVYATPGQWPWSREYEQQGQTGQMRLPGWAHVDLRVRRQNALYRTLSSLHDDYYTPPYIAEAARQTMGGIDLDPASCPLANRIVQAAAIFTLNEDGLSREWPGRVFLNPPYGGKQKHFVDKLLLELAANRTTEAVLLINSNAAETEWAEPIWRRAARIAITNHRPRFLGADPQDPPLNIDIPESSPTKGVMFGYWGPNADKFGEHFGEWSHVITEWAPARLTRAEFTNKYGGGKDWRLG